MRGIRELGLDCLSNEETQRIYAYLDEKQIGRVDIERFKDLLFYERKLESRNLQRYDSNFNTIALSSTSKLDYSDQIDEKSRNIISDKVRY